MGCDKADITGTFRVAAIEAKTNRWGNLYHSLRLSAPGPEPDIITQVFKPEQWAEFKGFLPEPGNLVYIELWEDKRPERSYFRPCLIRPPTEAEREAFLAARLNHAEAERGDRESHAEPSNNPPSEAPDISREAVIARSVAVKVAVQCPGLQNSDPGTIEEQKAWLAELFRISDLIKHYIETGQRPPEI